MEPNKSQNIRINRPGSSSRMGFNSMNAHRPTTSTTAREIPLTTPGEDDTPLAEPSVVTSGKKPAKSHKKLGMVLVCIVVAIVLLGIGAVAGVFVDREFLKESSDNTADVEQTPSVAQNNTATVTEETQITDAATLEDLTEKVRILTGGYNSDENGGYYISVDSPSSTTESDYYISRVYDGLSDADKLAITFAYTYLINHYDAHNVSDTIIPASEIESVYAELFGGVPTHQSIATNAENWCTAATYNATDNTYTAIAPGCGGTLLPTDESYIYDFTTDGTKAYVYLAAGSTDFNGEANADGNYPMNVYNDITSHETRQLLETVADYSGFAGIDSTNYQNFTSYRFVFNKDQGGNYYFEAVEAV